MLARLVARRAGHARLENRTSNSSDSRMKTRVSLARKERKRDKISPISLSRSQIFRDETAIKISCEKRY